VRFSAVTAYVVLLAAAIALTVAPARAAETAPGAACPGRGDCFVLTAVTVDGVTAYPLKDLAPLYADYLAREISPDDLVRIAQAITDKYRADGYFLSRAVVPPQSGPPGHARIRVYEGYIDEVQVTGDAAPALESLLAGLTEHRPLRLSDLERRLTLATDLPGVRARSRIEPMLDDPARHHLVVDASLQKWTASLSVDNRGTRDVGPVQATGRAGVNSLIRPGDQLALSVLTVPDDPGEFTQGELSYAAGLSNGARLRMAVSASRSRQGTSPLNNAVGNESRAAVVRLAVPLQRGRRQSVWASATFDVRHVEQVYTNGQAYSDDLRVLRAGLQLDRSAGGSYNGGYVLVSRGLNVLGASSQPGLTHSRFDADGQFWKVNVGGSHYNDIGRYAGLYLAADAQWAPKPLLFAEQFAPGGSPYGRAYNYSEIAGDKGLAGLAELRVGWDPKLGPLTFFQTYGFVDAAKTWYVPGRFGSGGSAALASAGGGVRLTFKRATLRLEIARPLTRTPFETGDKHWRGFMSLWTGF
jgi:hemolysin activation/secretion protein